jgi:acyl carrier protein
MTLEAFIDVLADQFDETDKSEFTSETRFKELEDWGSLTALAIIAMVDEEYNISISGDVIKKSSTVQELYNNIFE